MFSHKDVLPSGRILVFMITLGKTFFYLSVSTFIIASMKELHYNVTGQDRKELVGIVSKVVGMKAVYQFMPT